MVENGGVGVAPVADEVGDGELLGRGRGGVIPEEEVQEQPHQLGEHVLVVEGEMGWKEMKVSVE